MRPAIYFKRHFFCISFTVQHSDALRNIGNTRLSIIFLSTYFSVKRHTITSYIFVSFIMVCLLSVIFLLMSLLHSSGFLLWNWAVQCSKFRRSVLIIYWLEVLIFCRSKASWSLLCIFKYSMRNISSWHLLALPKSYMW